MTRLFISGPMRGVPDKNRPAFLEAETLLRMAGFRVYNPTKCDLLGSTWLTGMRHHIPAMIECDGLAALPGWEDSEGACIEVGLMKDLGLTVNSLYTWLKLGPLPEDAP